ncbi:MAG: flagellar biosynthesis anti-sigma factor FlgM [Gammaproteobacteria bacterium]|nr:flagellar biosynthesis anti-sigma factor FlgM [Gammaproteobacteria bacterium]
MAIEINNVSHSSGQISELSGHHREAAQPATNKAADTSSVPANRGDQVSLTPTAQQLRSLEEQVAAQPVVDTQRVNAARDALANGSFDINAERIAGKMMSLEKALGDMG